MLLRILQPAAKNLAEAARSIKTIAQGSKITERRFVSRDDVTTFAELTGDFNSVHFMENPIAHGVLINGYVSAILGTKLPGTGYVVVEQRMVFPNPCFVGEEIEISVEVAEARKVITCNYTCSVPARGCTIHEGVAKLVKSKSKKL